MPKKQMSQQLLKHGSDVSTLSDLTDVIQSLLFSGSSFCYEVIPRIWRTGSVFDFESEVSRIRLLSLNMFETQLVS